MSLFAAASASLGATVLPVASVVTAALVFAAGAPDRLAPLTPTELRAAADAAELQRCEQAGRDRAACLQESRGKALILQAERLAAAEPGDETRLARSDADERLLPDGSRP